MSPAGQPHLLHVFSTFVPAGPEMRTVRMINALGDEFRHSILAIDGRTDASKELDSDAPATILPNIERAGTPRTVLTLRALFKSERPDLVLSYNWGAFDSVIATRSLGLHKRHIHHEDGFNADESASFKGRRVWTRRLLLPGTAKVVVPSHVLAGIADEHWRLAQSHVNLIPNGIDLDAFGSGSSRNELRSGLGIPSDAVVIGFVGHLRPVKNPVRLVQAFAELRQDVPPHLLLLGEGEQRDAIEAAAEAARVASRVHLVGHQSDPAPWYAAMDVFALSSDSEQMPVALLEAMASSLPVASTDVGDVIHMLPSAQAEFVASGEAQTSKLAQAMQALVENPATRSELGAANRERVEERYSFQAMLGAYRALYNQTLQGQR
jgi:L-malate glycosyltransferase